MDKKQIKQGKKMSSLLDKALATKSVDEAFHVVKKEPFTSVDEKFAIIFHLGRVYEKQLMEIQMKQQLTQQNAKVKDNDTNKTDSSSTQPEE